MGRFPIGIRGWQLRGESLAWVDPNLWNYEDNISGVKMPRMGHHLLPLISWLSCLVGNRQVRSHPFWGRDKGYQCPKFIGLKCLQAMSKYILEVRAKARCHAYGIELARGCARGAAPARGRAIYVSPEPHVELLRTRHTTWFLDCIRGVDSRSTTNSGYSGSGGSATSGFNTSYGVQIASKYEANFCDLSKHTITIIPDEVEREVELMVLEKLGDPKRSCSSVHAAMPVNESGQSTRGSYGYSRCGHGSSSSLQQHLSVPRAEPEISDVVITGITLVFHRPAFVLFDLGLLYRMLSCFSGQTVPLAMPGVPKVKWMGSSVPRDRDIDYVINLKLGTKPISLFFIFVRKKNGTMRMCVDYQPFNKKSEENSGLIASIEACSSLVEKIRENQFDEDKLCPSQDKMLRGEVKDIVLGSYVVLRIR
ncbi:hypothetical protein MTR67_002731, partial [Solanum verrucosum]